MEYFSQNIVHFCWVKLFEWATLSFSIKHIETRFSKVHFFLYLCFSVFWLDKDKLNSEEYERVGLGDILLSVRYNVLFVKFLY